MMANRRLNKISRQIYSHTPIFKSYKGKVVVKLSDLVTPALGQALQSVAHKEMNMKMAWGVSKLMEERQAHIKTLETTRNVLLEKYCEKDETGEFKTNEAKTQYIIPNEKEYQKDYDELVSVDVECTMLREDDVNSLSTMTPAQLMALKPFIA